MLVPVEPQPDNLPAGYIIVQIDNYLYAPARKDKKGRLRKLGANCQYSNIGGAVASARMHASKKESKGKGLGLATGGKRRRTGGHGFFGGDGFREIH